MFRSISSFLVILLPPSVSFYQRGSIASYTSAGIARAEMSVCHTPVLCQKKASVTISSSSESPKTLILAYPAHTEIQMPPPPARAIYATGMGTNWWFSTFNFRNGAESKLLLVTNRTSHTCFRLVLKSTTLYDPELTLNDHYALCCITCISFGVHH